MDKLIEKIGMMSEHESIYLSEPKDVITAAAASMKLLDMERQSYENLFRLIMSDGDHVTDAIRLDEFMQKYTKNKTEYELLKDSLFMAVLGVENFKLISSIKDVYMQFHFDTSQVVIRKRSGATCNV
jgi:hypothetical protein